MNNIGLHDQDTLSRFRSQARVLKALAHPTRLFLVEELSRGERCVFDLTQLVGAEMSTVSKHLSLLKHEGILEDERRGAQVFYKLKAPCVLRFFSCLDAIRAQQ